MFNTCGLQWLLADYSQKGDRDKGVFILSRATKIHPKVVYILQSADNIQWIVACNPSTCYMEVSLEACEKYHYVLI